MNEYIQRAKKFKTKKRLGQNFLISHDVIDEIVNNVSKEDSVLEIGPGAGFVTEKLVEAAKHVVAIELDPDAINVLSKNLFLYKNFTLIQNDILKTNIEELFPKNEKIKIIANIPYYITALILLKLLGEIDDINHKVRGMTVEIILMVQLEVAKRIVANKFSKNKEYGLLSILSNFWADTSIIRYVSKKCFYPSPRVDSALVKFVIKDTPAVEITPYLKQTLRACFSTRRKNIKNCLKNQGFVNVEEALLKSRLQPNLRGENLSINDFYNLSCHLRKENDEV